MEEFSCVVLSKEISGFHQALKKKKSLGVIDLYLLLPGGCYGKVNMKSDYFVTWTEICFNSSPRDYAKFPMIQKNVI